jgi:succinyldiaminopimelate transaminase
VLSSDDPAEWPANTRLVWLNSPSNPDGRVRSLESLRAAVVRARELGAVIVNDECYAELNWSSGDESTHTPAPSILDPAVIQGSRDHVLSVYSLSKQSNLAGYRAGFVAGCSDLIDEILQVRKHIGLMPPAPVQAAMVATLGNDEHVVAQRAVYRARRDVLVAALQGAGFRIDDSSAGLYLWATRNEDSFATISWLADRGILAAPGSFYGDDPAIHVRLALTATDDDIARAAERLAAGV